MIKFWLMKIIQRFNYRIHLKEILEIIKRVIFCVCEITVNIRFILFEQHEIESF